MTAIPEFVLRKLYQKDSLVGREDGFSFTLHNSFAPATVLGFSLAVNEEPVPAERISLQKGLDAPLAGTQVTSEAPLSFGVGVQMGVEVQDTPLGEGNLHFTIVTREAGTLSFRLKAGEPEGKQRSAPPAPRPMRLFQRPLKTEVLLEAERVHGEIDPYIYGHFIEHLERCVYGGLWTEDGSALRADTLALVKALKPPLLRYPGGNFASGYHWMDGVGPKSERPQRYDEAWQSSESNQVGTDEFMSLCAEVGADPFLVVNCGNGTPEEAARWVAYCNQPAEGELGRLRAANGHEHPYNVRLWGIGNEVWGAWQIGHTDAETYTHRLRAFAEAMLAVDDSIKLVAVGDKVLSEEADDPGRIWNETVLRGAGDLIDYLSFHLYQPDQTGWLESYDMQKLHHSVCAAPLDAERIIQRIAAQIRELVPDKEIGIAFDEWNLWLTPPEGAASMHQVVYTMRDALYAAGMLNVFLRQCGSLKIANLAQLVNVLPLIVTGEESAYPTPIYHPFVLYQQMEPIALQVRVQGKFYDSEALGNISALKDIPYVDVAATRNREGSRVVLSIINRHPESRTYIDIELKGFAPMKLSGGWLMRNDDLLAYNSLQEPEVVKPKQVSMPEKRGSRFKLDLPPGSLSILILEKSE